MKFVRYIVVQILAYGLDIGGFLVGCYFFGDRPIVANIIGKIVAGVFAFFAHRNFTFGVAHAGKKSQQVTMYFLLLALNVPISSAVLSIVLLVISPPILAKFIADAVCVVSNYWISKKFVFPGGYKKSLSSDTPQVV